jgi:hypothetical protein
VVAPPPKKEESYSEEYGESGEEQRSAAKDSDDESALDETDFVEREIKKEKMKYQPKAAGKSNLANELIKKQNADIIKNKAPAQPAQEPEVVVERGKKLQKVLGKRKTITDKQGDWEVTDKRDTYTVQKPLDSSDAGSELSYD